MPQTSPNLDEVKKAILSTVAFFSLYDLPVNILNIHQVLYKTHADLVMVEEGVKQLLSENKLFSKNSLYALKDWDAHKLESNKIEIAKRWKKVNKYFWLLGLIPFVHQISVINSLAWGNAHLESDIDFFVVTKPNRLYFVRSVIIVLFKLLGVYKNRTYINERFCFGFYISSDHLNLEKVLLPDDDPHFAFWFAQFAPVLNKSGYEHLVAANPWIYSYFPNFDLDMRLAYMKNKNKILRVIKGSLEIILLIPAIILEPLLRQIHIRHTFNLPENHWETSTTVADKNMLKLHALDPRKDIRKRFYDLLQTLG